MSAAPTGWDSFLHALQVASSNFLLGVASGLSQPTQDRAVGAAIRGSTAPIQADIARGIRAKNMDQARTEYDLNQKQEYKTATDITAMQAQSFKPMEDGTGVQDQVMQGIRQGLRGVDQTGGQTGGRDPFGFEMRLPSLDPSTAAGRVANIGRTA